MQPSPTIVVASVEDAARLQRSMHAFLALKSDSIEVTHPALTEIERGSWNRRLTFLTKVCGCQPGAIAALAAIITCLVDPPFNLQTWLATALANIGFVVIVSISGKVAAVVAARMLIHFELQRLIRIMSGSAVRIAEG